MVVCTALLGFFEDANPAPFAALLLHKVVCLGSVLFRLSMWSLGLIVILSRIRWDARRLQCRLANQLPGPVQFQPIFGEHRVRKFPFVSTRFSNSTHRIAAASTLLMLRTFAIWNQNKFVVIPLVALALGQWGIAFFAVTTVKAHFDDAAGACVVAGVTKLHLDIIYLYSEPSLIRQKYKLLSKLLAMFLDAVVLIMTTIGLVSSSTLCTGNSSV